ncbi:class I SAM-dependent methyltransferase [Thermosulfurimonas sp. F29]|uniref:class I SAM-dependent methyltransferase n=1 Tax=Thermosulfurimonas sp. F29 TaxID=2867247 RepID=UPI001C8383D2|nr:methyltransferase domain-containing protein [Thermosulfurimonas sp. F29]MBX6423913.1 methyltransferase domain-containing protein [Thermosulfurimonas sp. F29]
MAHKFDPRNIEKLEDPSRLELFAPEETLRRLGLARGQVALDVGTGTGFYLPYLSALVGPEGWVYGVDVQEKMLEVARRKILDKGLTNVELVHSEENRIPLPDRVADFVFLAFTFHELREPLRFLRELRRVARPSAALGLIDWKKKERDKGPPPEEVYAEEEVLRFLKEGGLEVEEVFDLGPYCFAVRGRFP